MVSKYVTWVVAVLLAMGGVTSVHAQDKIFKVGLVVPLSGTIAEYGVALKNGVETAVQDNPEAFSKINFLFEDSRYESKTTLTSYSKLQHQDRADLIFVWGGTPSQAIAPVMTGQGYPTFIMSLNEPAFGNAINLSPPASYYTEALLKQLRHRGLKKFSIVLTEIPYLSGLVGAMAASLRPDEKIHEILRFAPTEMSFLSSIARLKNREHDAIGVMLVNGQISQFYRQMDALGWKIPTFSSDFLASATEVNASGRAVEGALYPHEAMSHDFHSRYIEKYGNDIQLPSAARGYDFANLVVWARGHKSRPSSGNEIVALLKESQTVHRGVSGDFQFAQSKVFGNYFDFPVVVKAIQNQKSVLLEAS